jgi:UPF0716 protein FxsA
MPFLFFFIVFPLLELTAFVFAARAIGLGATLLVCVLNAFAGIALIRHQSWQALRPVGADMRRGALPPAEVFDRLCLITAGVLFLIPGLISDFIALMLLIPAVRRGLRDRLERSARFEGAYYTSEQGSWRGPSAANDSSVIEGEYERLDEDGKNSKGSGPKLR